MNKLYSGEIKNNIINIRPYQILKIEERFDEEINFFMPQAQGQGSLHTLESIMLLKLIRIVDADYIFEFGTYKGLTTRFFLANLPSKDKLEDERIYTLDLPDIQDITFQGTDMELAKEAVNYKRKYLNHPKKHLVKQLLQDSMALDADLYLNKFQFIFIDANHEVTYVRRDTENAFKMLANAPSCIAWHDYGNPEFPELTAYIEDLSREIKIYHIENTMIAFYLIGIDVPSRD